LVPHNGQIAMATLGETIRTRRKELGLSQAELAQACGVHLRQIRRYESDEQQPVLTVAVQLAAALGLSIAELAGEPSAQPRLDGTWWASWQTFVKGEQVITSQPVALQQLGQTVRIEALEHSTEKTIADYLWRGELRVWDGHILMGWYAATDENVRDKGTMFFVMHTHGDYAQGRWVGNSYDGPIMSGHAALAHSRDEVLATIDTLIHGGRTEDAA
jgi:transcriptional regulator with XRE-family HTH domain